MHWLFMSHHHTRATTKQAKKGFQMFYLLKKWNIRKEMLIPYYKDLDKQTQRKD